MIQFSPDGRLPAGPSKSSVQTVLHPDGGGGAEAPAFVAATNDAARIRAVEEPAMRVREVGARRGRAPGGGDMRGPACSGRAVRCWRARRGRRGAEMLRPWPAGGPATGFSGSMWRVRWVGVLRRTGQRALSEA